MRQTDHLTRLQAPSSPRGLLDAILNHAIWRRDPALAGAVRAAREYTEYRFGGHTWVGHGADLVGTPGTYRPRAEAVDFAGAQARLLGRVLCGEQRVGGGDRPLAGQLKAAAAALLHECIHSLAGSDEAAMVRSERAYSEPWGAFWDEGLTELATQRTLDGFLLRAGVDRAAPLVLEVRRAGDYTPYVAGVGYLVSAIAERLGEDQDALLQRLVRAKAGCLSVTLLALATRPGSPPPCLDHGDQVRERLLAAFTAPLAGVQRQFHAGARSRSPDDWRALGLQAAKAAMTAFDQAASAGTGRVVETAAAPPPRPAPAPDVAELAAPQPASTLAGTAHLGASRAGPAATNGHRRA